MHTTEIKSIYLAGPMRGKPEFNFPAFNEAAANLRSKGYAVFNPAERDVIEDGFDPRKDQPKSLAHYMQHDLPAVCGSDCIVVLPGWQQSQGATLEVHVAKALGLPVLKYPDLEPEAEETIVTNKDTGGAKAAKSARFDLLPWDILEEDAKLYCEGAKKYAERNWERGYAWSLSFAAAIRHMTAFWQRRESLDPETRRHHLASARFHLAALMRFERDFPWLDDRPKPQGATNGSSDIHISHRPSGPFSQEP